MLEQRTAPDTMTGAATQLPTSRQFADTAARSSTTPSSAVRLRASSTAC
jgi:hypothetical protein